MIGRVNEIIKYNYYAYKLPLNCGINDESLIFKLDTIQLFMIMILQDRIMKDEKLKYKKIINI